MPHRHKSEDVEGRATGGRGQEGGETSGRARNGESGGGVVGLLKVVCAFTLHNLFSVLNFPVVKSICIWLVTMLLMDV